MNWNPFRPSHSLVLAFDAPTLDLDELETLLDEVGRYYRFATFAETAAKRHGRAAVVFTQARKGLFLRYLSTLQGRDIPLTVFAHPEAIGTNRLPEEEEQALYREHFAEASRLEDVSADEMRRRFGPLPIEKLNPEQFMVTWSRLTELHPVRSEIALALPSPTDERRIADGLAFVQGRVGRPVTSAWSPLGAVGVSAKKLQGLGLRQRLVPLKGLFERSTDRWLVPRWEPEAQSPAGDESSVETTDP